MLALLSILRPPASEVLHQLGLPVSEGKHSMVTTCPFCQATMYLQDSFLLCANKHCAWLAGSYMDIARIIRKDRSYTETIRWLISTFPDLFTGVVTTFSDLVETCSTQLTSNRQILNFLLSLRDNGTPGPETAWMNSWLSQNQIAPDVVDLTIFKLPQRKMAPLKNLITTCFPAAASHLNNLQDQSMFLVPHFSAPGMVSMLSFYNAKKSTVVDVSLSDIAYHFSGALQHVPGTRTVLCDSFLYAGVLNTQMHAVRPDASALGVHYRRSSTDKEVFMPMTSPVYAMHDKSRQAPVIAGSLRSKTPGLEFTTIAEVYQAGPVKPRTWAESIAFLLHKHCDDKGLTAVGKDCLRTASLREDEQVQVANELRKRGQHTAAIQVETTVGDQIVLCTDNLTLTSKSSGYEVKAHRKPPEMVTNFTAVPLRNVTFVQGADLCHLLRIHFDGTYYQTLVSRRILDSAQEMESAVQMAVSKARTAASSSMPVILSKSAFKHVTRHWKEHIATAKNSVGVASLGWSPDRKEYVMPDMTIGMDGIRQAAYTFHPGVIQFSHFQESQNPKLQEASLEKIAELPRASLDLLSMVVAAVARSFLHRIEYAVCLLHDHATTEFVGGVFKHLFQVSGMTTWNKLLDFTAGYPVFGYCSSNVMAAEIRGSAFLLTPGGFTLPIVQADHDSVDQVGEMGRQLICETVQWLMAGIDRDIPHFRHVMASSSLLEEGQWVIQKVTGKDVRPLCSELPYGYVDKYLASLGDVQGVARKMHYSSRKQKVVMDCAGVPNISELELEMRLLYGDSVERRGHVLAADGAKMLASISRFYGHYPKLEYVED